MSCVGYETQYIHVLTFKKDNKIISIRNLHLKIITGSILQSFKWTCTAMIMGINIRQDSLEAMYNKHTIITLERKFK